jgi:SAM-dependent methyltransferase
MPAKAVSTEHREDIERMQDFRSMWDQRYGASEFVYGTSANDFLAGCDLVPATGRALCLGAGEGRNVVFLAERGLEVTAVDLSSVGLEKTNRLAAERGVSDRVETEHADLAEYEASAARYDLVVAIFCHMPPPVRLAAHAQAARALAPSGLLLLEAYSKRQLEFRTGGPPVEALLYSAEQLQSDFDALSIISLQEVEREVHEGELHNGPSAVLQLLARKP